MNSSFPIVCPLADLLNTNLRRCSTVTGGRAVSRATNKKTARRRSLCKSDRGRQSGCASDLLAAAIGHEADAGKAKDHHRPGGGLGDGGRYLGHQHRSYLKHLWVAI